jgi:S-formylglutathione hydrolase FrmB
VTRRRALVALALAAGVAALVVPARGSSLRGRLVTTTLHSGALGRRERVLVYTPPGYSANSTRRYPLVILLHGVPGRPEEFVDHGVVGRLDRLIATGAIPPVIAAFPAGSDRPEDDNEWADSEVRGGERWESFLASDLVRWLDARYRTTARRAGRAIGGDSMGAFGAMNVALHHRDEFAAVSAWSGYFNANTPSVHHPGSPLWRATRRSSTPGACSRRCAPSTRASRSTWAATTSSPPRTSPSTAVSRRLTCRTASRSCGAPATAGTCGRGTSTAS